MYINGVSLAYVPADDTRKLTGPFSLAAKLIDQAARFRNNENRLLSFICNKELASRIDGNTPYCAKNEVIGAILVTHPEQLNQLHVRVVLVPKTRLSV